MIYSREEIEKMFIGSIIADNNNIVFAADIIKAGDLRTKAADIIWSVMVVMFASGRNIDGQTLMLEPGVKEHLLFLDGALDCGIKSNCVRLAEELAELGRLRRLKEKCGRLQNFDNQDSGEVLEDIKAIYTSELRSNQAAGDIKSCMVGFDQVVQENMAQGSLGIKTGFEIFDQLDIEYEPGHCWAYGGYTNVGKTALLIEQVCRVLLGGGTIPKMAIHSTEMKSHQLIARLLAGLTGIGHKLILRGKQDHTISKAKKFLYSSGLKIYDVNRDFDSFCNQCRKDKMQGGLDLVWADYLQNFKRKGLKGYELMADMGKDSLALPQELDLTLFMLSQISTSEFKEDSGGLAFKGAGELGESCDLGFWLSKCKTREMSMMVEHRKNRHGGKKDFILEFAPHSNRLNEI